MNDLSCINVITELERIGWTFEFAGEDELRVICPFHEDKNPSCGINIVKHQFKCQTAGCGEAGDFLTFLAKALNTTRRVVFEDLSKRYDLDTTKVINPQIIERYHKAVWAAKPLLKELYKRGMTDDLIRKYRIGYHDGRITIPIHNKNKHFVNVRRYAPGAPGKEKMRNTRGHGEIRLYPVEQLAYDVIVICGGELKAVVAASLLNEHNVGAVCATAGEGNWKHEFSKEFKGRRVYIAFDIDDEGSKAADSVCARVQGDALWVGKVQLPLDKDKYPHGDINDWVGQDGASAEDFLKLLQTVDEWVPPVSDSYDPSEEPETLHLAESVDAKHTGKRIKVKACVSALDTSPYIIPKKVIAKCDRNQDGCAACPIFLKTPDEKGLHYADISPESPAILEMVAAPKKAQRDALMSGLRIPMCKVVEFTPIEFYNVEDVRLAPQLEIGSRSADHIMQPSLCVGVGLEANESYEFSGRMFPHPKTQQSIILASTYAATQDALSNYEPSRSELADLRVFRPDEWSVEALTRKLDEIYGDFEANVTRIYKRRDMHLIIDLTYHSVLLFKFDGRTTKGWMEALVLGDSSQGKSETALGLQRHYNLGEKLECKNATVAGLLGGLQQIGSRWFVTWGIIPTHDKRLVILEELKGARTEVIAKLTDMRSSGVAEIPKIEKRRTHARTRLVALSNPRSDQTIASYNFGIEAVKELIGGLEDVRRFDVVLLVSASEIDAKVLNDLQRHRPKVTHVFTSELCRRLVLWAWTREEDEIEFEEAAYSAILDEATRLCSLFSEIIPIVDRGSMRLKLARLATALACRTFSTRKGTPEVVLVRVCHVEYVAQWLERLYSSKVFGYRDFTRAIEAATSLRDPDHLTQRITELPFPKDFIQAILHEQDIELRDIQDWCGWDYSDALEFLSFLRRKHALVREARVYRKTPAFIELLKKLELTVEDRPEYITEEEF